jgi:hypothetical protein
MTLAGRRSWLPAADAEGWSERRWHRTNRTVRTRAASALWDCRPTFSNHVALAGGQKEIDNTYGGPERKRHSHEHDNKDRNFRLGYAFHFSARIEPISPPHLSSIYFAAKRPSPDTPVLEKLHSVAIRAANACSFLHLSRRDRRVHSEGSLRQ